MKTVEALIDEAIAAENKDHVSSGKFKPSSFGYCYRNQFWKRKQEPESNPTDARGMRVLKAGKLFHDFVQGLLMDDTCQKEVRVESADVLGFADLVRDNEVIDIKSQHSKSFWWMEKKNCDIKKEKYSNWLQVGYYARELKKDFMRLVFVSKDDLCVAEYVQKLDDYWLHEIENELIVLRNLWAVGKLPNAEPRCEPKTDKKTGDVTFWQCEYCNFYDKCFSIEAKK